MSLGVKVYNGDLDVILKRNSRIPIEITENRFTTFFDFQTQVLVKVFEGDKKLA